MGHCNDLIYLTEADGHTTRAKGGCVSPIREPHWAPLARHQPRHDSQPLRIVGVGPILTEGQFWILVLCKGNGVVNIA